MLSRSNILMRLLPSLSLGVIVCLAVWPLLRTGFFPMHDDLQTIRLYEMHECFKAGQIPCRWVANMGLGYGFPLFNYYAPLPYYIGELFIVIGFSVISTVKILFIMSVLGAALGVYVLLKEFVGTIEALVGVAVSVFAPYRAVDIYVRGALSELFGLLFIPFALLFSYRLLHKVNTLNFIGFAVSIFGLMASHNVTAMLAIPLIGIWIIIWTILDKTYRNFFITCMAGFVGLLCSAFTFIPALFEQHLVQTGSLTADYFSYINHFATIKQLFFSQFWGYGGSGYGEGDGMAFQIGWPHWWLLLLVPVILLIFWKRKQTRLIILLIFFSGLFILSSFLVHSRSTPLWQIVSPLAYVQFPWRLLGLTMLCTGIIAGLIPHAIHHKLTKYLVSAIIALSAIAFNVRYFQPSEWWSTTTDSDIFAGTVWKQQTQGSAGDYLPVSVPKIPDYASSRVPIDIYNQATASSMQVLSDKWEFKATVPSGNAQFVVPIFSFPNWRIKDNTVPKLYTTNSEGLIVLDLGAGEHVISAELGNTQVRSLANMISIFGLILLVSLPLGNWYLLKRHTHA